jgi:hypothetical protein
MKKLLAILILLPGLTLAESGIKLHGLNLGFGSEGVTSTGLGIAFKSFYADYYMLPDESVTFSLSYLIKLNISALSFGSYVGITNINNDYLRGYDLGTEYRSYYQPYVRFYNAVEIATIEGGAKLSFILAR